MSGIDSQTIHGLYRQRAALDGNAVAVKAPQAVDLSYRGLVDQMQRVTETLGAWGIGRGDVVLIRLPNGPEPLVACHGVAAVAVVLVLDPMGSATELEHFLRFVQPKALILLHGADDQARALADQYGVRVIDILPTPDAGAGSFRFADPVAPPVTPPALNGPDDLAYLLSTSGTTALPKLVPKSQRAMLAIVSIPIDVCRRITDETPPLHLISFLPMQIAFTLMMASSALLSGGSVVCMPRFAPEAFFEWLDVYRPSFISAPPAVLEQIVALAPQNQPVLARYQPRFLYTAAAAMPDSVRAQLFRAFRVPMWQGYGMTEVSGIASKIIMPDDPPSAAVGRVRYPANTRVRGADGAFLPPGEVGEIVFRTEQFAGYWNNADANADVFVDGWFRTGDEGFIDGEGNLTIVGRVKEVINSGGAKVSPLEVETVLRQHPQVKDAAVFGLKHAELGELVAAAVVGETTERELRKFASERLPFYKVPTRIVFVAAIPIAATGKVQRNRLAELLGLT